MQSPETEKFCNVCAYVQALHRHPEMLCPRHHALKVLKALDKIGMPEEYKVKKFKDIEFHPAINIFFSEELDLEQSEEEF